MIGREKERRELEKLYASNKAEMVAVNGRRRVGKTYLVDEVFRGRITFRHAGLSPLDEDPNGLLKSQLKHFYNSLKLHGMKDGDIPESCFSTDFLHRDDQLQDITVFRLFPSNFFGDDPGFVPVAGAGDPAG